MSEEMLPGTWEELIDLDLVLRSLAAEVKLIGLQGAQPMRSISLASSFYQWIKKGWAERCDSVSDPWGAETGHQSKKFLFPNPRKSSTYHSNRRKAQVLRQPGCVGLRSWGTWLILSISYFLMCQTRCSPLLTSLSCWGNWSYIGQMPNQWWGKRKLGILVNSSYRLLKSSLDVAF